MDQLDRVRDLVAREHGLAVVTTQRADGSMPASVVNAGVLDHPVTGSPVVAFVARGGTKKLANLRARPRATVVFRVGWEWVAAEGTAELVGPDDPLAGFDVGTLPRLLRDVFTAAGGTHDDWDEYDRVMAAERRTAVLVRPERVYSNPG
ncbi:MAG: TIGR03618 family F420-dependent PPOX class oxidoreductase [Acidimicrobiia bacterium]